MDDRQTLSHDLSTTTAARMILRIVTTLLLLSYHLPSATSSSYRLKKPRSSVQQIMRKSNRRGGGRRGRGGSTAPLITDPQELQIYGRPFATFFEKYAASGANPRFHTLRTNGWKSLSMLTSLPPLTFAALLLAGKFITVRRSGDDSYYDVRVLL